MSDDLGFGRLIGPDEQRVRDAIHIAAAPVVGSEKLHPGQHIGFVKDDERTVGSGAQKLIGIVDPYLIGPVFPGQRFWMFVYPRTITGLSHRWDHPAFAGTVEPAPDSHSNRKSAAELWIGDFAARVGLSYDVIMDGARRYINTGDYLCFGGLLEGEYVPDEFWEHYINVTGNFVPEKDRGSFFTCSC